MEEPNQASTVKYLNIAGDDLNAQTIAELLSEGDFQQRSFGIYEFQWKTVQMIMTFVSRHTLKLLKWYDFPSELRFWERCDPEQLFEAPIDKIYKVEQTTLEQEVKNCQAVIIWTESTSIGFDIIDVCRRIKPEIKVWRAKFSEITAASVKWAIENLVEPNQLHQQAVEVQKELDLRIGAAFTRFLSLRVQRLSPPIPDEYRVLYYGSCQIPTLGFVVERYIEIERFVSKTFWKITLTHTIDKLTVEFNWANNSSDKECHEEYLKLCQSKPLVKIVNVMNKPKRKKRPLPLNTVKLQKLGWSMLKINPKETMRIARGLYKKGIISYPCTDTNIFPGDMELVELVKLQLENPEWGAFAQKILEWGPEPRNGIKSDHTRPPIHPTKYVTDLAGDEKKIYELVVRHFLACLSVDAVGSETVVDAVLGKEEFTASGLCTTYRNYLEVYPYDQWNSKEIHAYEKGSTFEPTEVSFHTGWTTAPNMLTEADLIALMEKHKIGTPSDRADHIDSNMSRGYIEKGDDDYLVPTNLGLVLVEGYNNMDPHLVTPEYREQFEADMKLILAGRKDSQVVLKEQVEKYKNLYQVMVEKAHVLDEAMQTYLNNESISSGQKRRRINLESEEGCSSGSSGVRFSGL